MKRFNALANRELFMFVAIVASAVTLHFREQTIDRTTPERATVSRMCEPSPHGIGDTRLHPADCEVRGGAAAKRIARPWV
ncbi:hypothetical protein [Caballeronia sp. Lep1P3]|uniref:hypothetical protein n=1 Tax=Caballeronia sp. Lep1P3 TaxID=2878150 RepID=UPI001FCFED69|nr:hypothetical protein [Caballeronia sp. Lep1P3]